VEHLLVGDARDETGKEHQPNHKQPQSRGSHPAAHCTPQRQPTICSAAESALAYTNYRNGEIVGFEIVAMDVDSGLALVVEMERYRARGSGREDNSPVPLHVMSILRPAGATGPCGN
jgi:hypothetical protein